MSTAIWSRKAERQLERYLDYLERIDPELPRRARREIYAEADQVARHPGMSRIARWPGLREQPLQPWHKILVLKVTQTEVIVTAFYDMRQDSPACGRES